MSFSDRDELLRAAIFHTPANPFASDRAMECHWDGGLLIRDGRIAACGEYAPLRDAHPDAITLDWRGGFLLPGFIDTHVHFPQVRVLGRLGGSLLDWLEHCALPEEARMASESYAREVACEFLSALASHGTTTALAFGAHFEGATATLFESAEAAGLRLITGLVLSDRRLRPELHQTPKAAYEASKSLIGRFHQRGRLLYAATPRFALSASEAMLEVCQSLACEHAGLRVQTHLNENPTEIAEVARLFPWARDYFGVYERYGLSGPGVVMAHNVHPAAGEIERLAASGTAVAYCPCSNAALGSGLFSFRRHLRAGVRCALGTDVGGGTGFGVMKEALQAHLMQRIAPEEVTLGPAHLLYLATRAGAEALGLDNLIGDFQIGKSADFVYLRSPVKTPLAAVLRQAESPERALTALFTMAGAESVSEVRVEGSAVYRRSSAA